MLFIKDGGEYILRSCFGKQTEVGGKYCDVTCLLDSCSQCELVKLIGRKGIGNNLDVLDLVTGTFLLLKEGE